MFHGDNASNKTEVIETCHNISGVVTGLKRACLASVWSFFPRSRTTVDVAAYPIDGRPNEGDAAQHR